MLIKYSSNNSGGDWWLSDEDWYKLEGAGWVIDWVKNQKNHTSDRFLRALATDAYIDLPEFSKGQEDKALEWARELWEMIVKQSSWAYGCKCCSGPPHDFYVIENEDRFDYVKTERNIPFPKPQGDDQYCHVVPLSSSFNNSTPFPFLKK